MITSNVRLMKTQIVLGSYDTVLFPRAAEQGEGIQPR